MAAEMMYKNTKLWQRARHQAETDGCRDAWNRLEAEYDKFWDKANRIAERISGELPGLTLHNEAHLNAVWEVADQLAGDDFSIEPIEVFVFGGAVLLHDLAHSVTAYEGRIEAVKKTPEWQEAVLRRLDLDDDAPDPSADEIEHPDPEILRGALFDSLRALHAEQAEKLFSQKFRLDGDDVYLIDDSEVRRHLGLLIGKIAASHHWDRETLRPRLRAKVGALGSAPKLGTIQPVKLACLLRCADACQIDQRRAPDFDMALQAPIGMSKLHWEAQNRLQIPFIEDSSLVFTSSIDFQEDQANTWWVAHDLIQIAHRELQECDALMRDQGLPTLCVKAVAGASDPKSLAEHVRPAGWTPIDASIRVSDPRRMVEMFGGSQYYGENALWVPLRELLQNGIDAIEARRLLEPEGSSYEGRILVEQVADKLDDIEGYWLNVYDDGIGMSERVLSRTLVDFGCSAKSSGELADEFEDLRGKRIRNIGQYGIGFFSILMLSEHIMVQSRRFDQGHGAVKKLQFSWGHERRPLLLAGDPHALKGMSTCISLFVDDETFHRLLSNLRKNDSSLAALVQQVAPLPNCRIEVLEEDGAEHLARSPSMYNQKDALNWLESIACGISINDLEKIAPFITKLYDLDRRLIGWSAFNFTHSYRDTYEDYIGEDDGFEDDGCIRTDRGLSVQVPRTDKRIVTDDFIGVLPSFSTGPNRSQAVAPHGKAFEAWLLAHLEQLRPHSFSHIERDNLSTHIYRYNHDPLAFATVSITTSSRQTEWYNLQELCASKSSFFTNIADDEVLLLDNRSAFVEKQEEIMKERYFTICENVPFDEVRSFRIDHSSTQVYLTSGIFKNLSQNRFYQYYNADCSDDFSFLGCLRRYCKNEDLIFSLSDPMDCLIGLELDLNTHDVSEIYRPARQLRIRPAT